MINKVSFLLLLLCIAAPGWTQILNVEKSRQKADSINQFVGALALDFTINNRSATSSDENRLIGLIFNSNLGYISKINK